MRAVWIKVGLTGAAVCVMGAMAAAETGPVRVEAGHPARLCLDQAVALLPGAAGGRRRAVLAVHEVRGDPGGLSVKADTGEDMLIGLFPEGAFIAPPEQIRRSFLPGRPASRCWDVELTGQGAASIALEVSEPLE